MRLFDRPPGELTDAELSAMLAVCGARMAEPGAPAGLGWVAVALAEERDRRRVLYAAAEAAASPVRAVCASCARLGVACGCACPARVLGSPGERRRWRGR